MFEPLLFHLFFLYSSLSLIDRSVKYARFLAVGKIFLVCFYLFVETVCHLYVFIQTSRTESSHTAPSLLPLHMMVSAGGGGWWCSSQSTGQWWLQVLLSFLRAWSKSSRLLGRNRRPTVPSGMPPFYIVVKSTWLSEESQSQHPQSGHSHSFKLIKVKKNTILARHF